MPKVSMILAIGPNNIIGIRDKLLWKSKLDFFHFKKITNHKPCVFGDKTFFGLPSYPLKNRLNIVVSNNLNGSHVLDTGYLKYSSIEEALQFTSNYDETMICGGASVYMYCLENDLIDKIYLTKIKIDGFDVTNFNEEDLVYFPSLDKYRDKYKINTLDYDICFEEDYCNGIDNSFEEWNKL